MGSLKCPNCGSMNTKKTADGHLTDAMSFALAIGVKAAVTSVKTMLNVHAHTSEFGAVYKSMSREYICKDCGHTFSDKKDESMESENESRISKPNEQAEGIKKIDNSNRYHYSSDTKRRVETILIHKLGVSSDMIIPTASLERDLGADELDLVEILMES